MFQKELDFFQKQQEELVEKHDGKTLVIIGNEVIGAYENPLEAYIEASKSYEVGSFMIQPCKPGPDAFTVTISTLGTINTEA